MGKRQDTSSKICLIRSQRSTSTTRLFCRSMRKIIADLDFEVAFTVVLGKRISRTWTHACLARVHEARTHGKVEPARRAGSAAENTWKVASTRRRVVRIVVMEKDSRHATNSRSWSASNKNCSTRPLSGTVSENYFCSSCPASKAMLTAQKNRPYTFSFHPVCNTKQPAWSFSM